MSAKTLAGVGATSCALAILAPLSVAVLTIVGVQSALAGSTAPQPSTSGGLSSEVPAEYASNIQAAAAACPGLPASLLAAQLAAESAWNPQATSSVGAQGIAQFMPATWATWGRDGDGDGTADPFNPHDAIAAQGAFMCSLLGKASATGWGDPLDLALAGYNAGWGAVAAFKGIPPYPETTAYVARIHDSQTRYEGPAESPPIAGEGGAVWPLAQPDPINNDFLHVPAGVNYSLGYHTGIDLNADRQIGGSDYGQPVVAARPGEIVQIARQGPLGLHVLIRHPDGMVSASCHLGGFVTGLAVGQQVIRGQQIGTVGCSGMSRCAPHLHFEVRKSTAWAAGNFVDPITWLGLGRP